MKLIETIINIYDIHKKYYRKYLTSDHFNFLNNTIYWTKDLKEQIYCIRHNIFKQPICLYETCNNFSNFKGTTEGYGAGGCCRKHGQFISNILNYGVRSVLSHKETQDKIAATNYITYGSINPMSNKTVSSKMGKTKQNYNETQKKEYLLKREKTWLAKYGVLNIFEDVDYIQQAVFAKYGVVNIAQAYESIGNSSLSKSKFKDYIWRTGEISRVQGYEPKVLKELEDSGYLFTDILTNKNHMPIIWYEFEGKNHRYYPDMFIPSENLIYEVKSIYTMTYEFYKNMLKAQATKKLGFDFKFIVL